MDKPPGDLWLPSLARSELAGQAYRYTIVLPLLSGPGEEFFARLKAVLKVIGRQEEILIERADVWLTPAANARRQR